MELSTCSNVEDHCRVKEYRRDHDLIPVMVHVMRWFYTQTVAEKNKGMTG